MKEVNLRLINRCHSIANWSVVIAVADYITAAVVGDPYMWWFIGIGVLANLTAIAASFYPSYVERRSLNAMLHSDNGNYVDPV
jgi:hypothetical protein